MVAVASGEIVAVGVLKSSNTMGINSQSAGVGDWCGAGIVVVASKVGVCAMVAPTVTLSVSSKLKPVANRKSNTAPIKAALAYINSTPLARSKTDYLIGCNLNGRPRPTAR
jgi:hypothetical protein